MTKHGKETKHVSYLLSCMAFETAGTFSPSVQNGKTKATGLIQFMPTTAKDLGTTIEALKAMDFMTQLDWVFKYFEKNKVFDKEKKGYYTVGDICVSIVDKYWEGMAPAKRLQLL